MLRKPPELVGELRHEMAEAQLVGVDAEAGKHLVAPVAERLHELGLGVGRELLERLDGQKHRRRWARRLSRCGRRLWSRGRLRNRRWLRFRRWGRPWFRRRLGCRSGGWLGLRSGGWRCCRLGCGRGLRLGRKLQRGRLRCRTFIRWGHRRLTGCWRSRRIGGRCGGEHAEALGCVDGGREDTVDGDAVGGLILGELLLGAGAEIAGLGHPELGLQALDLLAFRADAQPAEPHLHFLVVRGHACPHGGGGDRAFGAGEKQIVDPRVLGQRLDRRLEQNPQALGHATLDGLASERGEGVVGVGAVDVVARRAMVPRIGEVEHLISCGAQDGGRSAVGAVGVAQAQGGRDPVRLVLGGMRALLVDVAAGRQHVVLDAGCHVGMPGHGRAGERREAAGATEIEADHAAEGLVVGARILERDAVGVLDALRATQLAAAQTEGDDVVLALRPIAVGGDQQLELRLGDVEGLVD